MLGPFSRHRRHLSALGQPRASAWGSRCHLLAQGRSRPLRHGLELQKLPLNEACFVSERESRLGEVKYLLETTLRDGARQSWSPLPQGSPPGLVLHPLCRQTSPPALGVTVLTYKAPACPGVAQGDSLCPGPALGPLRARREPLAGAQGEGPTAGALLGSSPRPPLPPAWLPHAPHHQACALTSRGCPAAWKGKEHGPRGAQPGRSGSGENLAQASGTLAAGCFARVSARGCRCPSDGMGRAMPAGCPGHVVSGAQRVCGLPVDAPGRFVAEQVGAGAPSGWCLSAPPPEVRGPTGHAPRLPPPPGSQVPFLLAWLCPPRRPRCQLVTGPPTRALSRPFTGLGCSGCVTGGRMVSVRGSSSEGASPVWLPGRHGFWNEGFPHPVHGPRSPCPRAQRVLHPSPTGWSREQQGAAEAAQVSSSLRMTGASPSG